MRPWAAAVAASVLLLGLLAGAPVSADDGDPASGPGTDPSALAVPAIKLPRDWQQQFHTQDPAIGLLRASIKAARDGHGVPSRLRPTLATVDDSVGHLSPCNYAIDSIRRLCPRGDTEARRVIVVYGNSHGRHWINAVEAIAKRRHYRAYFLTKPSCLGSLVTPIYREGVFHGCTDFHRFALRSIARLHPDITLVSSSSVHSDAVIDSDGEVHRGKAPVRRAVYRGNLELFAALRSRTDRTVLLQDIPHLTRSASGCLRDGGGLDDCLTRIGPAATRDMREQLAAASRSRGVQIVRTWQWFCWQGVCPAVVGNRLPYRDDQHQTNPYSASLAMPLAGRIGVPQ